jgi:hypothetical protein
MHLGINKLLLSFCFSVLYSALSSQPTVKLSGPDQAQIGMGTTAKVRIINTNIHGPARISINVPEAWKLENYPGELASVSQSGNQIKIIWLEFPMTDTVDVVFLLKIPENMNKGNYSINGYFDYFKNDKVMKLAVPPHTYRVHKYYTRVQ